MSFIPKKYNYKSNVNTLHHMWTYKDQQINEITDFPNNTFGFIYRIIHTPTGKSYIGKKVLFHNRKVKLTKKQLAEYEGVVGRRPAYKIVTYKKIINLL